MSPYEFGQKFAADLASASAVPSRPRGAGIAIPAGMISSRDDWSVSYGTPPVQPKPAAPAKHTPYRVNPEHQQIMTNLGKQYPQFGRGDLQDMLSLHLQGRGGALPTFTRNTQNMYQQNPAHAANYVPPPPTPQSR